MAIRYSDYNSWEREAKKRGAKVTRGLHEGGSQFELAIADLSNGERIGEFLVDQKRGYIHNTSFQNGVTRAEQEISNKINNSGLKVENQMNMSTEQLKKLARQGTLELQQDIDHLRPGQHVEVVLSSPDGRKTKRWVRIENNQLPSFVRDHYQKIGYNIVNFSYRDNHTLIVRFKDKLGSAGTDSWRDIDSSGKPYVPAGRWAWAQRTWK